MATWNQTLDRRTLPVWTDIGWWTLVGLAVVAGAGPLATWWGVRPLALVLGGLALVLAGGALALWLRRLRPVPGRILSLFGATNLACAPLLAVVAGLGVLPLTRAGTGALWVATGVVLVLGAWQLRAARSR